MTASITDCPCGSGQSYSACCEPFITGAAIAPTPEATMRSRYTAFAVVNIDYLHDTLASDQRHDFSRDDAEKWARNSKWLGLEIHGTTGGGPEDSEGTVDFTARFKMDGRNEAHREISLFRREGDRWAYVEGQIGGPKQEQRRVAVKAGRNDPCPCGSGKKYKKCCGG
jgi:SEC-C motif-containing protein